MSDEREALLNFIVSYRELPVLWDVSSKEYSNRDKKNEAYDKLVQVYKNIKRNATKEDVKKKINSLRTNFRKDLRKIEDSKRSGDFAEKVYIPKCWTFKELSFLIESSNNSPPCLSSENPQVIYEIEENEADTICTTANPSSFMTPQVDIKKRKALKTSRIDDKEEEPFKFMNSVNQHLRTMDEYSAFGDLISYKIRNLHSARLRHVAQNQIMNVLFELEMCDENLDSSSPNQESTTPTVVNNSSNHISESTNEIQTMSLQCS